MPGAAFHAFSSRVPVPDVAGEDVRLAVIGNVCDGDTFRAEGGVERDLLNVISAAESGTTVSSTMMAMRIIPYLLRDECKTSGTSVM